MECIGRQSTLEDMRAEKAEKFKELKSNRNSKQFERWFLRYVPLQLDESRVETTPSKKTDKKTENKTEKKKPKAKKANKSAKARKPSNGVMSRIQKLLK